ncbi:MAG TPA: aspartate ammonia-lyase, partial [Bdellovibrionota bacterium]|nr:aspartate ammonia-lyase [Bdellovibrionota bacterium]
MSSTRTEHDSLGEVKVPKDALYGPQTARAIENFPISGRSTHPALVRAYLQLKSAAARANLAAGALPDDAADLITRAVDELLSIPESEWPQHFPVDVFQAGAGTSTHMSVNEVIANVANRLAGHPLGTYSPIHPNDHVNRSQSTNDTFPTAMRLALLEATRGLAESVERLSSAFSHKAGEWGDIPKSARTHLQDAVPMRLGQEFAAYAITLRKCARWIEDGRNELRELGIGGSAAGTGLTVPKGYAPRIVQELSKITGERLRLAPDLCEAMQSQAPILHYSSMLRLLSIELTRICNDIRLLASGPMTGLAEILLPAVQPGSSIMPGKVNPSILEMANQAFYSVLGQDATVAYATQAGQLELNVMMPIMASTLLDATTVATRAIETLRTRCIEGLEANEARLLRYFESTPQVATALSPKLGYEKTAKLVQES